jgi:protoporphyrinogen oxidase
MPLQAPAGKTMITADIGCERDDEMWTASDDDLHRLCLDALTPIVPDIHRRDLGVRVSRTPIAYPVYLAAYEERRKAFSEDTGIDGLLSIGRNGEFAHILMEDVYWRTRAQISAWARAHAA